MADPQWKSEGTGSGSGTWLVFLAAPISADKAATDSDTDPSWKLQVGTTHEWSGNNVVRTANVLDAVTSQRAVAGRPLPVNPEGVKENFEPQQCSADRTPSVWGEADGGKGTLRCHPSADYSFFRHTVRNTTRTKGISSKARPCTWPLSCQVCTLDSLYTSLKAWNGRSSKGCSVNGEKLASRRMIRRGPLGPGTAPSPLPPPPQMRHPPATLRKTKKTKKHEHSGCKPATRTVPRQTEGPNVGQLRAP